MSETVQAALITVIGMVLVAGLTGVIQFLVTRSVIQSEREKVLKQLENESLIRRWESRYDCLVNLLGEFISATDATCDKHDESWLPLMHKIQLLLRNDGQCESDLIDAMNQVGLAIHELKKTDERAYLALHSNLIESARTVLSYYHP
ncbi:hypothetical protein [Bremerella sp.]|uniref:hypothetical protein n=1 Tax=Bremerella sp. TaxID=2795602 RepID=UPI00391A60E2